MRIDSVNYNKTSFKKRWSQIVRDHNINDKLTTSNLRFIKGAIRISNKWKKNGYSVEFQAKIGAIECGPKGKQKKVKGIMIKSLHTRNWLYISQTDILMDLFHDNSEQALKKKNRAEVLQMMRQVINSQIDEFRKTWEKEIVELKEIDLFLFNEACKCPISGKNLLSTDIAVDHDLPFIELAKEFWRLNNIDPFTALVVGSTFNRSFEDANMTLAWIEYHRTNAKLQIVDSTSNLKKNKKSTEDYLKSMADSAKFIHDNRLALKGL